MRTILFNALVVIFLLACNSESKEKTISVEAPRSTVSNHIQVVQFHSTHRCITCRAIEKLSKELLSDFPTVPFRLVNVDDPENESFAAEFGATGTALFLYDSVTNKKTDLTEFAFMNAKSKQDEFKRGLKAELENF